MKDGGPAFPESHPACPFPASGLTKREWFAGMAMLGLIVRGPDARINDESVDIFKLTAGAAYSQADAMLAEAEKGGPE